MWLGIDLPEVKNQVVYLLKLLLTSFNKTINSAVCSGVGSEAPVMSANVKNRKADDILIIWITTFDFDELVYGILLK